MDWLADNEAPPVFLNTAKQVIQIAPKGLMLAQGEISGIILLMSTDFPQIVERKGASVFRICPDDPQAEQKSIVRRKAARFVGGGEKQFMFFKILLQKKNITNIVIKQSTALKTEVSELLNQYGFSSRSVVNSDYFLFSKQTAEPLNE